MGFRWYHTIMVYGEDFPQGVTRTEESDEYGEYYINREWVQGERNTDSENEPYWLFDNEEPKKWSGFSKDMLQLSRDNPSRIVAADIADVTETGSRFISRTWYLSGEQIGLYEGNEHSCPLYPEGYEPKDDLHEIVGRELRTWIEDTADIFANRFNYMNGVPPDQWDNLVRVKHHPEDGTVEIGVLLKTKKFNHYVLNGVSCHADERSVVVRHHNDGFIIMIVYAADEIRDVLEEERDSDSDLEKFGFFTADREFKFLVEEAVKDG